MNLKASVILHLEWNNDLAPIYINVIGILTRTVMQWSFYMTLNVLNYTSPNTTGVAIDSLYVQLYVDTEDMKIKCFIATVRSSNSVNPLYGLTSPAIVRPARTTPPSTPKTPVGSS
jgi:hypothetical protein